jgi:hypothetical protein
VVDYLESMECDDHVHHERGSVGHMVFQVPIDA